MSEYIYEVNTPFQYALKGEMQDAKFISITAPTYKQIDKFSPIKQAFTLAISEISEAGETSEVDTSAVDEKNEITAAQILQVMYRSTADITKVFLHAEQLFKSGAALINGEDPLTSPLMQKMTAQDFEGLTGAYIANFIAPSLMDGQ